jgi:hypothetical protein
MPDLNEAGFEVLQVAVRAARDRQIRTLKALREFLDTQFPNRKDDIDQAVKYWSAYVRRDAVLEQTA